VVGAGRQGYFLSIPPGAGGGQQQGVRKKPGAGEEYGHYPPLARAHARLSAATSSPGARPIDQFSSCSSGVACEHDPLFLAV
jgi:hypothetical protein